MYSDSRFFFVAKQSSFSQKLRTLCVYLNAIPTGKPYRAVLSRAGNFCCRCTANFRKGADAAVIPETGDAFFLHRYRHNGADNARREAEKASGALHFERAMSCIKSPSVVPILGFFFFLYFVRLSVDRYHYLALLSPAKPQNESVHWII